MGTKLTAQEKQVLNLLNRELVGALKTIEDDGLRRKVREEIAARVASVVETYQQWKSDPEFLGMGR